MRKILFILLPAIIILAVSCSNKEVPGIYESGKIVYKITYLENNLKHISTSLLPKKMYLEFDQDSSVNLIEGFMGVLKMNSITYFKHKNCSTLLEVLNKKYLYMGEKGENMCCFDDMEGMKIQKTHETKKIAGLNCKKAIIKMPKQNLSYEIYYTNDIKLNNPNITNPYENIDGVLMDFQLKLTTIKMRLTAEKFEYVEKNNLHNTIIIPKDHVKVNREQMIQIMYRLLE